MSTQIAPITATKMLCRFTPVARFPPNKTNSHPPSTAPTIPRRMSRTRPEPALLTTLLAMKPAISPRMIHEMRDIAFAPTPLDLFCSDVAQKCGLQTGIGGEHGEVHAAV